jgi:spermidine/putrescine transport system permease protein
VQGYTLTWHFANYVDAIRDNWHLFVRSFLYAGIATVVCLLLGYPLAYAIAFKAGRWKNFMLVLVIAPFFTSFLLRTLSWKTILADQGPVADFLRTVHLLPPDGRLLATPVAVIAGLIYNFMPFMTLPLFASLDKVDYRLIEASGDLYSSPLTGFRKVTFPLSLPGVVSGTLLTFIPACGDYINAEILGTPKQYMVGNRIQAAFLTEHDYPLAASLSLILMVIVVLMVVAYVRRVGTEELV